ncbi:DUF4412 domain-containing protein [Balneolales bacterium ANBcel1]|nr:DUF4412 domain-containing protein [Balneolales bacterium ANBcel1]
MPDKRFFIAFATLLLTAAFSIGFAAGPKGASSGKHGTSPPFLTLPAAQPDTLFEGTLHYSLYINDMQQNFTYQIRNGLVRIEIEDRQWGGTLKLLISPEEKRVIVLIDEIQAYSELEFATVAEHGEPFVENLVQFVPTQNRQEIAGVENTEYYLVTEDGGEIRFWSPADSRRYGHFRFPDFGKYIPARLLDQDLSEGLFPFAIYYKDESNTVEIVLQHIEENRLDPGLFSVPATYRNINVAMPDY